MITCRITPGTVVNIWKTAILSFQCSDLVDACCQFISKNLVSISKTDSFLDLSAEDVLELISLIQNQKTSQHEDEVKFFSVLILCMFLRTSISIRCFLPSSNHTRHLWSILSSLQTLKTTRRCWAYRWVLWLLLVSDLRGWNELAEERRVQSRSRWENPGRCKVATALVSMLEQDGERWYGHIVSQVCFLLLRFFNEPSSSFNVRDPCWCWLVENACQRKDMEFHGAWMGNMQGGIWRNFVIWGKHPTLSN